MTTAAEANARRWRKEVRGESEVIGEQKALREIVTGRFGDDTAAALVKHYRAANGSSRMAKVGEWLHECKTGDELLARVRQEWGSQSKS